MTMPRRSRAERRREGSLPAGEDPLLRRPPAAGRPGPAVPPMTGRRRTDQPGPAPSPADVPTSATLSATGGATRAGQDAGPSRAPVAPSAGRAAAAAPSP
ncbi:MAG: LytR cell envelope-related transcriptional attenuator, partial [Modestobacter sp.]|nr:LytR cell envelope-related transcriptional attenuator [Modestobacter sp.]